MNALLQLFDINNTLFTFLGYQISYLEFIGTLFNLACVWLVARKNIWNWPIGIIGVIFFGILFYQINLYSDLIEQIYYFITGFWGWYLWAKVRRPDNENEVRVERNSTRANIMWIVGIAVASLLAGWAMSHVHEWAPAVFPEPAALPLLDATTTIMSFAATILMMQRKLENWVLWILVDIIAVWLYWYKEVPFISLLYFLFLCIATSGFIGWRKSLRSQS